MYVGISQPAASTPKNNVGPGPESDIYIILQLINQHLEAMFIYRHRGTHRAPSHSRFLHYSIVLTMRRSLEWCLYTDFVELSLDAMLSTAGLAYRHLAMAHTAIAAKDT